MGVHTFNVEGYSVNGEGCSVCRMIIKLFFCCCFFFFLIYTYLIMVWELGGHICSYFL